MDRDEKIKKINELYFKERNYQLCAFGEYENIRSLNLASFLLLIEEYLQKAKKSYTGPWTKELPTWLKSCDEYHLDESAPVETYEELIKVFTLAGAALETYANINLKEWRENIEDDLKKWEKE
jgi:hypothetical protein